MRQMILTLHMIGSEDCILRHFIVKSEQEAEQIIRSYCVEELEMSEALSTHEMLSERLRLHDEEAWYLGYPEQDVHPVRWYLGE